MTALRNLLIIAIALYLMSARPAANLHPSAAGDTAKIQYKNFMPAKVQGDQLIVHKAYCLDYSSQYRQARWVAYRLSAAMCNEGEEERSDNFRADPAVEGSSTPADYAHSGYDRGHLCPAGDMSWNAGAMSESFLMSNMSPQQPGFNRGIWKKLETDVRCWAREDQEVIVIAGGVLGDGLTTIGPNHVAVPRYFYKVVYDVEEPVTKAIAFIIPNKSSKASIHRYAVSVDSVERLTGLDFFPELPDLLEIRLESECDTTLWPHGSCKF